jgi:eukaryotic-like serine/threonine-protein kinase
VSELVGKTLRDYYVLRRLGHGAMAEVYLAQQLSLGRQVALKVLNAELARDPAYVQRFHHEARAAAALVHAGIVQIYEVGKFDDGQHFIAQEYVPGRNLGEIIRTQGRLGAGLTLDILRQATAALAKAASAGIVHRDIKPENIMLARSGEVKVADFGLARVSGDGGVNLTQIGVTMGTPLYMSPEQIEGQQIDSRSDIYSLGVTAYHMLAGSPPYEGETPLAVAVQHLNQTPEPLETRRPDVPPELASLVHRMLAKKPEERFTDPAELLRELHGLARRGAEQGWATGAENWSLAELITVADDRAAATARLETVMRTAAQSSPLRRPIARWLATAAALVLFGLALAILSRPRSLLAGARSGPPRLEDVWAQLYHAKTVDTEAAWQAAYEYPGATSYEKNLALQGLALHYLSNEPKQYEQAIRPLRELADLGSSHPALAAFGVAGLVVAETGLGHLDQARVENERLSPAMRSSVSQRTPQLAEALDEADNALNPQPE